MVKPTSSLLSQVSFSILFALRDKPRHGYDIMKQISEDSAGRVIIGAGALYGSLKLLREQNLLEEIPFEGDARRRYYRLTIRGWQILEREIEYFNRIASLSSISGSV